MSGTRRPKRAGGQLARSETVTIRLDPQMRYLAEIAGRVHRRTMSSYIEWAIIESFSNIQLPGATQSLAELASALWDVDEPDRFVILAHRFPQLLTHDEQKRWKLIRENGALWRGMYSSPSQGSRWTWDPNDVESLVLPKLRKHWESFVAAASSDTPKEPLPTWYEVEWTVEQYEQDTGCRMSPEEIENFKRDRREHNSPR